jgi:membrane-associated phospholipid phosphatase
VVWGAAAVAFSILMGVSRAYLAAHWLSDAVAGILLGWSCALVVAVAVNELQRRRDTRQSARVPVPDAARPADLR